MIDHNLLHSRFNPDGSPLREAQMVMFDILVCVADIFERNDIEYWIEGGTLLGAKRHGGFIPWDDDLDIDVPACHYRRAMKALERELPACYYLETKGKDPNYKCHWSKVKQIGSVIEEPDTVALRQRGIFIDIFSVRCLGKFEHKALYTIQCFKQKRLSTASYIVKVCVEVLMKLASIVLFFEKRRYWVSDNMYLQYKFPDEVIHPLSQIEFEGRSFPCPGRVESYLELHYNRWWQLPEAGNIHTHASHITLCDKK